MSRPLAAAAAAVVLLTTAPAAPVPKARPRPPAYYPAAVGATWTLSDGGSAFVYAVTAAERKDGGVVATVSVRLDGRPHAARRVAVSARGVALVALDGDPLDPPEQVLRYPYTPGETWRVGSFHGDPAALTATAHEPEEVEVPAGRYKAARVTYDGTWNGNPAKLTYWYAAGVGPVQVRQQWAGVDRLWRLTASTPGREAGPP